MPDSARTEPIPTNLRLLLLLEEVAQAGIPVTPADVGASLGLPKPTIHRLFHTAELEGFIQRDIDGKSYGPGPRMRRLSVNTLSSQRIRAARLAILRNVAEKIGETCNIATPDRDGMVYLDRVETKWPLRIQLPIGTQVPFHATASGKMYLSSLSPSYVQRFMASRPLEARTERTLTDLGVLQDALAQTKAQGYSTDNEEFMVGMAAVAVPILDDRNRVVSTLSVHAPVQRHQLEDLERNVDQLQQAAQELSALLLT